jgi:hypothetical protein
MDDQQRWQYFENYRSEIEGIMRTIQEVSPDKCADIPFLEHDLIPALGLNNESLHEQPPELSEYFGRGLHLWQYPAQLARYLAWLSKNSAGVRTYMEIGCRWGGTFILISEWLRRFSRQLSTVVAVDPIGKTPLLEEYFSQLANSGVETVFLKKFSTSPEIRDFVDARRPDFIFIDGDHNLEGAFRDHLLARTSASIIVHHDVSSQACPGTSFLWSALKQIEAPTFQSVEFLDQYPSVKGSFLGIGVLHRVDNGSVSGDHRVDELASSMYCRLSNGRNILADRHDPGRRQDVDDVIKAAFLFMGVQPRVLN